MNKYEFMGTRVYKDKPVGSRPDLAAEPVDGLDFPDLDQARLQNIWNGAKFGGRYPFLYLNKFYTYNKTLTDEQNDDSRNTGNVKPVSANGKTVYNIYYDRQVYDLYFTKSNVPGKDTFYPEIWRYNQKLGEPGNPYHFKARFNQRLVGWPNDALETKGFDEGKQSFGWSPNFYKPFWTYRDTPPYRLSAKEFLDMDVYNTYSGYTNEIDAGNGKIIKVNWEASPKTFTTLSFGIEQRGLDYGGNKPIAHHMDFWMDGFDENPSSSKKIIDYDLYQTKADTNSSTYKHKPPVVQGFTPYEANGVESQQLTETELSNMNDTRAAETDFPDGMVEDVYGNTLQKGKMQFMYAFFNNADEFGDPVHRDGAFDTNGYIRFHYKRNKYPLRFNTDPTKPKDDRQYTTREQKDIFYQKPLKELNLDDANTLLNLGLTDLLEKDSNEKYRIKRPEGLEPNKVFKGWALDPAGLKMVSTSNETMPHHALVLYAIWEEPDFKWKVTFDPDGGNLPAISETTLAKKTKTIFEGDAGLGRNVTYPVKEANEGDKQIFTVLHRQKLKELLGDAKPTKEGYSFSAWEVLHYQKDANGNYTNKVDTSFHDKYGVPELYGFGNDVVDPIYLKAIWVPDNMEKVTVYHHFLDKEYRIATRVSPNPKSRVIENQRAGQFLQSTGSEQSDSWRLATNAELVNSPDPKLHKIYDEYNGRLGFNNNYFQMITVEPKMTTDSDGHLVANPKYKNNVFHFFYVPFRTRNYKVNYLDERAKAKLAKTTDPAEKQKIIDKYRILPQERVESEARHYDARNYKPISGWKLTSDPQQQLFYDVDEDTNKFLGINGTGSDEITFYYKDVRIIEVPKEGTPPQGYVRVTFKASNGGSFGTDSTGNPIKELNYDVLEGTKSDQLPVPQKLPSGGPVNGKYYVTPNQHYSFARWDNNPLLEDGTVLMKKADQSPYVFTAMFDQHPLVTDGVVTTESFKDQDGTWINDFAPTLDELKGSIQQKENGVPTALPAGTTVEFFDEHGAAIATRAAINDLIKENGTSDTEEPVRTINLKAKVTFNDDPNNPREMTVPIKVYKNRYEETRYGEMPDKLKTATGPDGDLVKLLEGTTAKNYVKVTVKPTNKLGLPSKTYWVNPKAWVDIPEIEIDPSEKAASGFKHWTADQIAQNENKAAGGVYDFAKRHKFIAETTITPIFPETPGPNPPGPNPPGPNPPGPNPPGPNPPTPGTPGTPGTPWTPWTPTPGTPGGTPGTPTPTPTPSTPSTPSTPGAPGTPGTPGGTPAAPGSPAAPSSPDHKDKSYLSELPATGANSLLYLYAAVLLTLTGALVLRISRKRVRD